MRARQHNAIRSVGYFPNLISIAVRNLTYSRADSSGMQRINAELGGSSSHQNPRRSDTVAAEEAGSTPLMGSFGM